MNASQWIFLSVFYLGYLQYGLAVSTMNAMLEELSEDLGFDKNVGGAIVAATVFLCTGVGGLMAGSFERVFREYTQIVIGAMYLTGNILCFLATSHKSCWGGPFSGCIADMILCGRFMIGFASAMALVLSPRYLAQVSPIQIRGAILSALQLCGAVGVLVGFIIGTPYDFGDVDIGYEWWRVMFMISALPAGAQALLACTVLSLYRTPRKELQMKFQSATTGESTDAPLLESETQVIAQQVVDGDCSVSKWQRFGKSTTALFSRKYRRSVIIGLGVPAACHSSGANIMLSYSTTILKDAGFDKAILGGCIIGFTLVLLTAVSVRLLDTVGRRTLAVISFVGMAASYLGLALSSLAGENVSSLLSVAFVLGFISFFSIGAGVLNAMYAAEVSPPELSATVLGLGLLVKSCVSMLLVLVFPSVLHACGPLATFLALFAINLLALAFVTLHMVETKGRSLEEILAELTKQ